MQKFLNWLEKVLTPLAKIIGENKYLIAIRDGFLISTPFTDCWIVLPTFGEFSDSELEQHDFSNFRK